LTRPAEEYDNEDMIIVGDVDKCIRKMQKFADMGVDQLLCYVQFGQLPHESVMRGIELLGKEVIPVMEIYEPKR
jgi:alkanesulfonate monooxygenase SsuD/methylene tetrahydromethanopterin reductase-like flavin-dependent oxidoreductase (luciferase family)